MTTDFPNDAASSPSGDPYLLTPGPLTTSLGVKQAMLHDYGSRDATFIELNARVLERLVDIVGGRGCQLQLERRGPARRTVDRHPGAGRL